MILARARQMISDTQSVYLILYKQIQMDERMRNVSLEFDNSVKYKESIKINKVRIVKTNMKYALLVIKAEIWDQKILTTFCRSA